MSKLKKVLLYLLAGLNLLDIFFTHQLVVILKIAREINPLINYVVRVTGGWGVVIGLKIILSILIIMFLDKIKIRVSVILLMVMLYSYIVGTQVWMLLR